MAISKSAELAGAGPYPANRHNQRERKLLETSESYSPSTAADWTGLPGVSEAPSTQDAALDTLAGQANAGQMKTVKAQYDYSVDGSGTSIGLGVTLPDNSVVINVSEEVLTDIDSSSGTSTVKLNIPTDGDIGSDITADGSNAGFTVGRADFATPGDWVKTTAQRELTLVSDVDDLTAGKVSFWVTYLESE